ncbi:tryptophanyl-tRNA synthetase [Parachaetomium inaequale]|uniref:Tryptophan--tRNA ligase, cytoplasmic n=1 Tax=Parachaetomium inaequale TaxID=2588326 RepID=A0AAN6PHH0_9PEZI|nr:tryptophanyl-tRNA synthetase [Parachaetomium inaequale]
MENAEAPRATHEQNINPWSVTGEVGDDGKVKPINYNKLVEQFGTKIIDNDLLERFKRVTGHELHRFLRREIVFSHRDLDLILDKHEKKEPFFIYTGRGPSSDVMHIGHMVPFELTKWLSDVFQVPLIVMLTDDEKYLIGKMDRTIDEYEHFARENAKDIVALGFNPDRTFIFSDYGFMGSDFYRNITRVAKRINRGTADACFGFDSSTNIGKVISQSPSASGSGGTQVNGYQIHFAAVQAASSFATSFPFLFGPDKAQAAKIPCLIPCAVDQDPYFRLTRDVASQLGYAKPSLIHARFLDALQGPGSKMSASVESSSILVRDTPKQILNKINQYAFSGGRETLEEHRAKGGDPDVDVSYQYLRFFLEDDEELERIGQDYRSGRMTTGEMKKRCADELIKFCTSFQERRAKVTDEMLDLFMRPRPLLWGGLKTDTVLPFVAGEVSDSRAAGDSKTPGSKNQAKKEKKMQLAAEKKLQKTRERDTGNAGADAVAPEV